MRIASALWHAVIAAAAVRSRPRRPAARTAPAGPSASRNRPSGAEVAAGRPVDAPSGCGPRRGVDRLDLAAVALRRPRIEDGDDLPAAATSVVPVDRPRPGVAQRELAGRRTPARRVGERAADRDPRLDPAVEQADVGDGRGRRASTTAGPRSCRPRRRRRRWSLASSKPSSRHPRGEGGRGGERVPARARRRREVARRGRRRPPRAGARLGVVAPALRPVVQPPADVGDSQGRVAEAVLQGLGGDQGHGREDTHGRTPAILSRGAATAPRPGPRRPRGSFAPA